MKVRFLQKRRRLPYQPLALHLKPLLPGISISQVQLMSD